jgi:hypothetical protein
MLVRGVFLVMAFAAFESQASERCMSAVRALNAGAVPSAEDFAAADCGAHPPVPAVRYDANMRAARLTRGLAQGEIIAGIPSSMMASVSPGQKLYVTVQAGPVLVQREVEALQPANPGRKLFVRAADGKVMSVLYSAGGK